MGGVGSGRHFHWGSKDKVTDMLRLDVRKLAREGGLSPGHRYQWLWQLSGGQTADITIQAEVDSLQLIYIYGSRHLAAEALDYSISLERTHCHFGGLRTWFRCPKRYCGKRVAILYGGRIFACRDCHKLTYPVQNENLADRLSRRAEKVRARLGEYHDGLSRNFGKPKGMHWRTYDRLLSEAQHYEKAAIQALLGQLAHDSGAAAMLDDSYDIAR